MDYQEVLSNEENQSETIVGDSASNTKVDLVTSDNDAEFELALSEQMAKQAHEQLQDRLESLKSSLSSLKDQISKEKELWRNEVEAIIAMHTNLVRNNNCLCDRYYTLGDYDQEELKLCSLSAYDLDMELARYHNDVLRARAVKKCNIHRQMAINNYRRRLIEVESMCNIELLKVKQSVQNLQPLQMMASEWNSESSVLGKGGYSLSPTHKSDTSLEKCDKVSLTGSEVSSAIGRSVTEKSHSKTVL